MNLIIRKPKLGHSTKQLFKNYRSIKSKEKLHQDNGILLGRKKEENFTLCDNMDRPGERYAK